MESEFRLNDLHIEYLKGLRRNKRRLLFGSYGTFIIMFIVVFLWPIGGLLLEAKISGDNWLEQHIFQIVGFPILAVVVYKVIGHFIVKTIIPLNKDIKQRSGILESHQIIRKQYFPMTGHAYFFFDEIDIPNITVDEPTFHHYKEGDYISVRKAKHSRIVFEDVDRQEIDTTYDFDETYDKWPYNQNRL